jgi:hypothetical protein
MRLAFAKPDHLVVVPDFHPAYGLDDTTRAEVLRLVLVDGLSVREAVIRSTTPVGQSTVYRWLSVVKKGL